MVREKGENPIQKDVTGSREIARGLDLRYEEIKGDNALVKKLLNGPWDEDLVVAPPRYTVALSDFKRF